MSDIYDLLAASLLKDNTSAVSDNPFSSAGAGIGAVLGTMPQYNLKPWEALLAGALGGFASGALKGYGQQSETRKQAEITDKLLEALSSEGGLDSAAITATPELAKYAPLLKLNEMEEKKRREDALADALLKLKSQGPKVFSVQSGLDSITLSRDPVTGQVSELARGPKFAPRAETGISDDVANNLASLAAGLQGQTAPDDATINTYRKEGTARLANSLLQAGAVQNRFAANKDIEKKKTSLFGYEAVDDSFQLQPSELDDLRRKVGATQEIITKLDVLADKDLTQIAGQDSQTQSAMSALMFQAFRNKTGSGANLTKNEEGLINAMMPALASGNLVEAIKRGALGRDQKQFSKDLQGILQDGLDVELFSQGLKRKSRSLESYPPKLRETMGVGFYSPTGGADRATAPKRFPGESVAEYKRRVGQ